MKETQNHEVNVDEGFVEGEGYPSCDGSPCANMADSEPKVEELADNMSDTDEQPKAEAVEPPTPQEEAAIWRDKFMRLQAEFDNYRKRTLKEKMDLMQSGGEDVLKAILPVVDDLQRGVEAMAKSDDIDALRAGVELINQKFAQALSQRGVKEIEAVGLELDTDRHEAVARFAAGEDKSGKIIDVVQRGYTLGDKVLRFAKVVVGE